MANKLNKTKYGFVIGLILPVLMLTGMYVMQKTTYSVSEFFRFNYRIGELGKFLSIALVVNLIPFVLANQFHKTQFAKGVFLITLIYAIPIIVIYIMSM